jgi:hypothetical protein
MSEILTHPATIIQADRVQKGAAVKKEIVAVFQETGRGLPTLTLFGPWSNRKQDWTSRDEYEVEEISTPMPGRAFLLHRDEAGIARDARRDPSDEPATRYGVLLADNNQDHICECHGFTAHGRCKHVDGLKAVINAGQLDHPMAGRPVEPFPSESQVTHDALIEAPF